MFKRALTLACCALFFATFSARADEWNKKTVVTFSGPVELPGIVLPAGTYVFKLLDSQSNRHIVQVFNEEETKIYTTILAIPNYRLAPTGETVIRFAERPRGTPEAMRAWFYPGDNFGQEFVYPKTRAISLAAEVKAPVLAAPLTPETPKEEMVTAPVEAVAPPAEEAPAAAPVEAKPAAPEAAPAPAAVEEPAPQAAPELPKTASSIPLVALLGATALLFALVLKRVS